eukprot:761030-Hanusia_phi.AAC.2
MMGSRFLSVLALTCMLLPRCVSDNPVTCSWMRQPGCKHALVSSLPCKVLRGGARRRRRMRDHKIGPDVLDFTGVKAIPHDNEPRLPNYTGEEEEEEEEEREECRLTRGDYDDARESEEEGRVVCQCSQQGTSSEVDQTYEEDGEDQVLR